MTNGKAEAVEVEERVDVDALMEEVRRRVAERRASGDYGGDVREPAFAELALYDDLAASANRVAAAARLPDVVPSLSPIPPGAGSEGDDLSSEVELATLPTSQRGIGERAMGLARQVARKAVGNRLDQFIRSVEDFFAASSDNSRITAERVIALERRVAELEEEARRD